MQDIDSHLRGGIPNRDLDDLQRYWDVFPGVRSTLFKKANRAGYSQLRGAVGDIKSSIFEHEEFKVGALSARVEAHLKKMGFAS